MQNQMEEQVLTELIKRYWNLETDKEREAVFNDLTKTPHLFCKFSMQALANGLPIPRIYLTGIKHLNQSSHVPFVPGGYGSSGQQEEEMEANMEIKLKNVIERYWSTITDEDFEEIHNDLKKTPHFFSAFMMLAIAGVLHLPPQFYDDIGMRHHSSVAREASEQQYRRAFPPPSRNQPPQVEATPRNPPIRQVVEQFTTNDARELIGIMAIFKTLETEEDRKAFLDDLKKKTPDLYMEFCIKLQVDHQQKQQSMQTIEKEMENLDTGDDWELIENE